MAITLSSNITNGLGILGNVVSFLVYLAPMPTFYNIIKKKTTGGFQAIPYSVAMFSAMLYLYYAFLKDKAMILITINTIGGVMEFGYLTVYMIYATKSSRVFTTKLLLLLNVSSLGIIIGATYFFAKGPARLKIVGWIGAIFSVVVYAAPLSIMRKVIQTKSVEFMPFSLSFFLTICSVVWFLYGYLISDYYIAAPNILGFAFGVVQMVMYVVYKNKGTKQNQASSDKVHDIDVEMNNSLGRHNRENGSGNQSSKHGLDIDVEMNNSLGRHNRENGSGNQLSKHGSDIEIVVLDQYKEKQAVQSQELPQGEN